MSLFGIITYVPTSALVTSSKTPPKIVPQKFAFGKPFSQFGKGMLGLPLRSVAGVSLGLPLRANTKDCY